MTVEGKSDAHAQALARVDPRWDAARTERALAALHRRRARRRATSVLLGSAALVALALVGWTIVEGAPAPRAAIDPSPREIDRVVRLADGSRVTPDEGADVVVDHVSDARIAVRIERGAADVEVVPGLARRFEVRAGEVTVTVLGTAFRVERLDEVRVRVSVEHGHVDVSWPAGHADLVAGQDGIFPTPDVAAATELAPDTAAASADLPVALPRDHPAREVSAAPSTWRDLAHASRYDDAYSALGSPAERADAIGDRVDDLLLAADVARLSGHPVEALPWLARVEHEHASDPRAVLATFTRGRLLMDLGRPAEAAQELERAIAMEPDGSLAEDALARAALAHAAAGDDESASTLADRYVAAYPGGRWSSRVRAISSGAGSR